MPDLRRVRTIALVVLAISVVLTGLGYGVNNVGLPPVFDLDGEWVVPSVWSCALLAAAAAATWAARGDLGRATVPVAALFAFMALDELASAHERLESAVGVDWQLLYAPVVLAGGVAWLLMLRDLRRVPVAAACWVLGAGAWFVAQVLEKLEWDGDVQRPGYFAKMYVEEFLEMGGSTLFLVSMLCVIVAVRGRAGCGAA
ncbi:MAG: hypothetical protein LH468_08780 [Nocardioides sp.]|nr:hypothetical protein [Nocardioides sp.]